MRHRRYIVAFSLAVHLAIVLALFVTGFWKLERLDAGRRTFDLAVAAPPAPAPAGGAAAAKVEFKKKQPTKQVVKQVVQPTETPLREDKPSAESTAETGDGTGSGSGSGSGTDTDGTTGECTEPPCGVDETVKPAPAVHIPPPQKDTFVPPAVIRGLRIRGETQIHPPDVEKTAMLRSGKPRASATVKVCVGEHGEITSLSFMKPSGYAGWDAEILRLLRGWQYRPYKIGARAVKVCGAVTFLYEIK